MKRDAVSLRVEQRYLPWIAHSRLRWFIGAGVVAYLAFVVFFAVVYAATRSVSGATGEEALQFYEILSFSLVTQSTLGYGTVIPVTALGHVIVMFQVVLGIVMMAVFTGSVVARILIPSPDALATSPNVAFDRKTGHFSFRFLNRLSVDLFDVHLFLLVIRRRESDLMSNRTQTELMVSAVSYLRSMSPVTLRTSPSTPLDSHVHDRQELPRRLSPQELGRIKLDNGQEYGPVEELRLIVVAATATGQLNRLFSFPRESIICGSHVSVESPQGQMRWENFDKIEETDQEVQCGTCGWRAECGLRVFGTA